MTCSPVSAGRTNGARERAPSPTCSPPTRVRQHSSVAVTRSEPVLDRYRGGAEPYTRDLYDGRLFREETFLPLVGGVEARARSTDQDDLVAARPRRPARRRTRQEGRRASNLHRPLRRARRHRRAAALLGGALAFTTPGTVGIVGYGGGRATGVTVTVEEPVPGADRIDLARGARETAYGEILRARGVLQPTGETVAMGVPPMSAGMQRGAREILGLSGAKCVDCGIVNTPPSIHPHCLACGADKFTDVALARTGTVVTYVVNHTMPAPFVAPLPLAVVDLEDGARLMLQVTGGAPAAEALAIGDSVQLVLRRYAVERGVPVYGYKVERV